MPKCTHVVSEALLDQVYESLNSAIFFYKYTKNGEQGYQIRNLALLLTMELGSVFTPPSPARDNAEHYILRLCFDRNEVTRNSAIKLLPNIAQKYPFVGPSPSLSSIVSNLHLFPSPLKASILKGIIFFLGDIASPLHTEILDSLQLDRSLYPLVFELFAQCKLNSIAFDSFCSFFLFLFSMDGLRSFLASPDCSQ